ncbi:MAG: DUF1559 domain-containing protein [Planctomycetota bacterium]
MANRPRITDQHASRPGGRRHGYTLVELLVVVTVVTILIGLLLPAVQAAREAARARTCTNNLKQIGLALHSYESSYRRLPPGARLHDQPMQPSIGWRVEILSHVEQATLHDQMEPQQHGGAKDVSVARSLAPSLYQCPSAERPFATAQTDSVSHYAGVSGAYRGDERIDLEDTACGDVYTNGILYPGSETRLAEITDGTSNTLMVGERLYIFRDWVSGATRLESPFKLICSGATKNVRFPINSAPALTGYHVGDQLAPPDAVKDKLLNDLYFASSHPGGANFLLADGSVHFVSERLDFPTFQDLATKSGAEVVSW